MFEIAKIRRLTAEEAHRTEPCMDQDKKRGRTKPLNTAPAQPVNGEGDRRLQTILQQIPLITYALDLNGNVTMMEGRAIEPELLNAGAVIGRSIHDLSGIFEIPDLDNLLQKALNGENTRTVIQIGDQFFEAHSAPLYRNQEIEGVIGIAYDVSEWQKDKNALHDAQQTKSDLLEDIEDGYYETDLEGNYTAVNSAMARILGCAKADLLGGKPVSFRSLIDENAVDVLERAFNHVQRTGKPVRALEGKIGRDDRSSTTIELSISLRRDGSGQAVGFHGIARDVTDRKAVEEALAQRMVLLSVLQQVDNELNHTLEVKKVLKVALNAALILSGAETGFIGLIKADTVAVVRVSGQYEERDYEVPLPIEAGVTGRAIRQRQAQRVIDVSVDPDYMADIPETRAEIAIPLITHEKLLGVINLETSKPEQFTEAVFEYVQMLTARVAAAIENARLYEVSQEQLGAMRDLYTQLSELEQLKTDMIRIVSHDLRGPLGIILGYLDILSFDLEPVLTDEQRSYMDAIRRAGERIQRMSTEILSLERVNALRNQPRATISLNDLVLKAIVEHRDSARQKDINLIMQLDTTPVEVMGDGVSLPEAIANLVSNAIKYTLPGGFVTVRLAREGADMALFEVIDTGVGIREEGQSHLFEPFYRVRSEETAKIDGSGLGLYLVKRIIEQHHGTLRFSSKYGEGSTFGFVLPMSEKEVMSDG
ncbi:MAG: PAS domain S-box protein [Anaerolineae bacterium]|nr:PAS domain S-box protein [Anaerolineae bacterium]